MWVKSNFQIELNKANRSLNEETPLNEAHSNVGSWLALAQTGTQDAKDQLYREINDSLFGGKEPYGGRIQMSKFDNGEFSKVFKYLKKSSVNGAMDLLFNQKTIGIGSGEIMLAYIVENLTIGGGSQPIDLNLWKTGKRWNHFDSCELKEAKLTGSGFLEGWQLGANHARISINTIREFRELYDHLKHKVPELDPSGAGAELVQGFDTGEWGTAPDGKRFKHLSKVKSIEMGADRDFTLSPGVDGKIVIKYNDEVLGDLGESSTIDAIKQIMGSKVVSKIKTFDQIHDELIKQMGNIKEKFLFIASKGVSGSKKVENFYYKKNLPGNTKLLQLHSITLNKCKFRIKA